MKRVDVLVVYLQDSRIILNCILILAELSVTVSSVVKCFYVVLLAILDFEAIVLDGTLKLVHLAEHKASVRVDDRISWIKFDCSVEVVYRVLKPISMLNFRNKPRTASNENNKTNLHSGVAVATGAIVPVDSVLLVKTDSLREVLNSLLVFEKSVPYQPAPVVAWRIVSIRLKHLVEVFEG